MMPLLVERGESHPTWVRGLKPRVSLLSTLRSSSHPTWVRGLKLTAYVGFHLLNVSHPTWVRGLKPAECDWGKAETRRTLRGCVD